MKNIKIQLVIALLVSNFIAFAQNPGATSPQVQPAPLTAIGDACTLTCKVGNLGAGPITGATNSRKMKFNISLAKCVPVPASIASLSGSILTAFDVVYNAGTNTFSGTQKAGFSIAGTELYTVSIAAVVTQTAAITNPFIGFQLNIQQAPFYAAYNNQSDDAISAFTYIQIPLSTQFEGFSLMPASDCQLNLNWTVNNKNNDIKNFEIYQSLDGSNYTVTKVVNAIESQNQYSTSVSNQKSLKFIFVKAIEKSNKSFSSKVLPGALCTEVTFNVYPNPVIDVLKVDVNDATEDNDVVIIIRDVAGKDIKRVDARAIANTTNTIDVDFNNIASGLYSVTVQYGAKKSVTQIRKN
jgi:Secretion system C-terminal sorting domain